MAFRAGGGRRRQRFSAFMATFFLVSFLSFSKWKEKRQVGLWAQRRRRPERRRRRRRRKPGLGGPGRAWRGGGCGGRGVREGREPRRPAGHALPPRGRREGWLSRCRGPGSPTQRPTLAEAELLREWRRVAKQHLEEPGWTIYRVEV